jgi:hypothetical protein
MLHSFAKNRAVLFFLAAALSATSALPATGIECRLSSRTVPSYGRIEIQFPDAWNVENPDDPRQADVTGVFVSPSGREWLMPGFLYRDFERQGDRIAPQGKAAWRVRFTPMEAGEWKASVRANIAGRAFTGDAGTFAVEKAQARGFLRRAKANPLALEFENGAPLIAIGSNVFPKTLIGTPAGAGRALDVIRYLERTAQAGGNFCRIRVDSRFLPIELPRDEVNGYQGPGRYQPQACWEVDQIVAAAERLGITLQFCIDDGNSNTNPEPPNTGEKGGPLPLAGYRLYMKEHGGPLTSLDQFWTDAEVKRLFLQRMRYSVARWGASTAIGVWEFFNEIKLTPETIDAIAAWHSDLGRQWKQIDPYQRLVTTSPVGGYNPADFWWKLFRVPELDLIEYHTYRFEDVAAGIASWNLDIMKQADKPLLVGEFGSSVRLRLEIGGRGSDPKLDPAGLHLHNGMWASALTGAAGALPWFINNYIDPLDLYHVYTGFSRFAADWKINAGPWRPIPATVQADFARIGKDNWGPLDLPVHDAMAPADSDTYQVNRDGTIEGALTPNGFLFGLTAHKNYRRPPTFAVDYPKDGKFIITVKDVIGKESVPAPLIVELDGREVARKVFALGKGRGKSATFDPRYNHWSVTYDEEVAIPVPPGKHRICVDFGGTDRMSVGYRLDPYADRSLSVYRVYAMGFGREARLWVQNAANTAANRLHKRPPVDQPPATIRLAVSKLGRYEAEWWDTVKGVPTRRESVEAKDGFVVLNFPGTLSDEACKLR